MCNGAAKQVSPGVATCNMVSLVKLFRTSVTRQVSRKVEPLSTSATARNGRSGKKKKFHRVTLLRETGLVRRCTQASAKSLKRVTAALEVVNLAPLVTTSVGFVFTG